MVSKEVNHYSEEGLHATFGKELAEKIIKKAKLRGKTVIKDIEDAKESLNEVNDSLTVFQEDVEETQKWIQKKIKKTAIKIVKWINKMIKAIFKWFFSIALITLLR